MRASLEEFVADAERVFASARDRLAVDSIRPTFKRRCQGERIAYVSRAHAPGKPRTIGAVDTFEKTGPHRWRDQRGLRTVEENQKACTEVLLINLARTASFDARRGVVSHRWKRRRPVRR